MYDHNLHTAIGDLFTGNLSRKNKKDTGFRNRFIANASAIQSLYNELYGEHLRNNECFDALLQTITEAYSKRRNGLKKRDLEKLKKGKWFLSNELAGMSLYVDRFCGKIEDLESKIPYLKDLGVNLLHLMPLFESPAGASDGGYAVSDFRKVDKKYGNLKDLETLRKTLNKEEMYLLTDIVLNHASDQHEWAMKAKAGDKKYQEYFHMFSERLLPDEYEKTMKEIFPTAAPGNFTWIPECEKWVMTVFHNYQWDLNYSNPEVLVAMLDTIFFYANIGIDILRIDAPAFIWKQLGTTCANLPQAHLLLRLIRLCVEVAATGMALLGEAIQAPRFIITYFGQGEFVARECDFCYNATQMALQWDALATGDTSVMMAAQPVILQKPYGASWITYTRCHDDIGLGYEDQMIASAGYQPVEHRKFLKNYYSGIVPYSSARGELFSSNPKTGDARISGTLASLCGLEAALEAGNEADIDLSIQKILMMQAMSFFIGGLPMLFYGDEVAYTNSNAYLEDAAKSYDNRWMHRPIIDWHKNELRDKNDSVEQRVFSGTKKLLAIRKSLPAIADYSNLAWLPQHNIHVAAFTRHTAHQKIFCIFNFSSKEAFLTWYVFRETGLDPENLFDHWTGQNFTPGRDDEYLILAPYGFHIMEAKLF